MLARPFPRLRRNWDLCSFDKPRTAMKMPIPPVLYNIFSFIIAATCAFALSPLCCRVAVRIGAVDIPADGRRMHTRATPRVGGLAVFFAFAVVLAVPMLGQMATTAWIVLNTTKSMTVVFGTMCLFFWK